MNQLKNIHFSLLIRLNNRLHEFNFLQRPDGSFDGDTSDERGNRHYFKMIRRGDGWQLQGTGLPPWISANEHVIAVSLQEKERRN